MKFEQLILTIIGVIVSLQLFAQDPVGIGTSNPAYPLHIVGYPNTVFVNRGSGHSPLKLYSTGDGTHNNAPISIYTYGSGGTQDLNFSIQNWSGSYIFKYGATGGYYDAVRITKGGGGGNGPNSGYGVINVLGLNQASTISLSGNGNSYLNGGKVGIGHTSPDMKLDVRTEDAYISRFHHNGNLAIPGVRIGRTSSSSDLVVLSSGFGIGAATAGSGLPMNSQNVNHIDFFISNSSGNIGVGTVDPETKFHVQKESAGVNSQYATAIIEAMDSHLDIISTSAGTWGSSINLIEGGGSTNTDIWSIARQTTNGSGSSDLYFNFGTTNNHVNTQKVVFTSEGSLCIGTNNSHGYKLAVNGSSIMEEVKVKLKSTWPDYVFTPSYNLQSLSEVETFINENGHLPNIPSAAEVEENNGIELGEMNAKLLEKIEELTLHTINQQKTIDALLERIEKLENQ